MLAHYEVVRADVFESRFLCWKVGHHIVVLIAYAPLMAFRAAFDEFVVIGTERFAHKHSPFLPRHMISKNATFHTRRYNSPQKDGSIKNDRLAGDLKDDPDACLEKKT